MRRCKLPLAYSFRSWRWTGPILVILAPLTTALPHLLSPDELSDTKDEYTSSPATDDPFDTIYPAMPYPQPNLGAYFFSAFAIVLGVLIIVGYIYVPKYWKHRKELDAARQADLGLQTEGRGSATKFPPRCTTALAALRSLRLNFMAPQTSTSLKKKPSRANRGLGHPYNCRCRVCGPEQSKSRLSASTGPSPPAEDVGMNVGPSLRDSLQIPSSAPRARQADENLHREASIIEVPDSPLSPQQHEFQLAQDNPMASYAIPEPEISPSGKLPRFSSFSTSIARIFDMPGLIDYSRSLSIKSLMKSDLTSNSRMTNDFVKPPDPDESSPGNFGAAARTLSVTPISDSLLRTSPPTDAEFSTSRAWLSDDDWLPAEDSYPAPSDPPLNLQPIEEGTTAPVEYASDVSIT
ncbi:hypothetical protein OBBRIDRAFT_148012 [Obba rivulosa]|uniref:Uncharacterized protein n=1 Tax=Obba rivulosa TaxID=1052685 RepID=A0A8E2DJ81_9APHY|nr:hypothetical protein OBBRIDRAFT_148012 [Obba rivulosa]